jgi:hypothetical protein
LGLLLRNHEKAESAIFCSYLESTLRGNDIPASLAIPLTALGSSIGESRRPWVSFADGDNDPLGIGILEHSQRPGRRRHQLLRPVKRIACRTKVSSTVWLLSSGPKRVSALLGHRKPLPKTKAWHHCHRKVLDTTTQPTQACFRHFFLCRCVKGTCDMLILATFISSCNAGSPILLLFSDLLRRIQSMH